MTQVIKDKFGTELKEGDVVKVYQTDGTRTATIHKIYDPASVTVNQPGHWVDIDSGSGPEGMMSYILEKISSG